MGVSVNSAGSTTGAVAMAGTLTIKNANKDSRARIEYVCGKSKSSGTKKKLNYNYKFPISFCVQRNRRGQQMR